MSKAAKIPSALNSSQVYLAAFSVLFAVAICTLMAVNWSLSYDGYWHLRTGADLVLNGLSPWIDHYSYTYLGEPINSPPVLFQVVLFALSQVFGDDHSFVVYTAATLIFCLSLVVYRARRLDCPMLFLAVVIPFLVGMLCFRAFARPELVSYCLVVIAFILYDRARAEFNRRNFLLIAALLLFWVNYHNPIFGYIIFFGLFLDLGIDRLSRRRASPSWWLLFASGLLLLALGFFRPGGGHFLIDQFQFDIRWTEAITEYLSVSERYGRVSLFGFFWGVCAFTAAWLFARRRWGHVVVLVVAALAFWTYNRMIGFAALVLVSTLTTLIAHEPWARHMEKSKRTTQVVVGLFLLAFVATSVDAALKLLTLRQPLLYPGDVVKFMQQENKQGAVFNYYEAGGYLIQKRGRENPVFIDGRTDILYPFEHYQTYDDIAYGALEKASVAAKQYGFKFVLWSLDRDVFDRWSAAGFHLEFFDQNFMLLSKGSEPALANVGKILFRSPCWDGEPDQLAAMEMNALLTHAGSYPSLAAEHSFLKQVFSQGSAGFSTQSADALSVPLLIRFAAHAAYLNGNYEQSLQLLQRLKVPSFEDVATAAIQLLRMDRIDDAEVLVANNINRIPADDHRYSQLFADLISELANRKPLTRIDSQVESVLRSRVEKQGSTGGATLLDSKTPLCLVE